MDLPRNYHLALKAKYQKISKSPPPQKICLPGGNKKEYTTLPWSLKRESPDWRVVRESDSPWFPNSKDWRERDMVRSDLFACLLLTGDLRADKEIIFNTE